MRLRASLAASARARRAHVQYEAAEHVEHRAHLVDLLGRAADHADEIAGGGCVRAAADATVDDGDTAVRRAGAQLEYRVSGDGADDDDGDAGRAAGEHAVGSLEHRARPGRR